MNKKPLKARITAVTTAILTMTAMCLPAAAFASSSGVTKEETVYVVTDSSGTQQDVIVSDHLINKDKIKTISDETNLSDVENVKGEETFKQDGDALTWDAEGNGIYYQGKSSDEIPVSMDVVYRLDDKVVSGPELQGKSGKVEIKINYENDAEYEGTTVPFVVMTGLIVTDDSFKNIKISKGKVIDDGEKLLVVGMAAPGLAQTLGIGESDLGIGSSVTITGDAEEFAVEDMMTVVTNAFFEDVDTDGIDLDYDDEINALNKGSKALVDGSKQLYDGLTTMNDNMPALESGIDQLATGASGLNKGTQGAKTGAESLNNGISNLKTQLGDLISAAPLLHQLSQGLLGGLNKMKQGLDGTEGSAGLITTLNDTSEDMIGVDGTAADAEEVYEYLKKIEPLINANKENLAKENEEYGELAGQIDKITEKAGNVYTNTMKDGGTVSAVSSELQNVSDNLGAYDPTKGQSQQTTLIGNMTVLDGNLGTINSNMSELTTGLGALSTGAGDLAAGEQELATGAKALADGMEALQNKSGTLINGVDQLDKGSLKLSQGMSKLYNEGIKKIVDLYQDDLKGTLDSVDSMMDAGKGYKTFTRLPSGMDGNVKFIYKTDMTD